MRIGIFSDAANRHTHRWATWLQRKGERVILFSDRAPRPDMDYGDVKIVGPTWTFLLNVYAFKLHGGPYANNWHKWRAYRAAVDEANLDLLHAHEAIGYGPTLEHFPEYPRVLTPWGPDMEALEEADAERMRLTLAAIRSADIITTNAPGLEEHWSRIANVPREKLELFSWGVDLNIFQRRNQRQQREIRKALGISESLPIILSPRLAKNHYRIEALLAAWEAARGISPKGSMLRRAQLVVLRAGADESSWKTLQEKRRFSGDASIHLIDQYLTPDEMAALYTASTAVVMLPKTDLLAMSLLEAVACGTLPIIVNQPCYKTAISDLSATGSAHGRGIFLDGAEPEQIAVGLNRLALLGEDDLLEIAGVNGGYAALHQDWDKCATRMLGVYESARRMHGARTLM